MKNFKRCLLFIIIFIFSTMTTFADDIGYNKISDISTRNKSYIVLHHHDWSEKTRQSRWEMISTDKDPFSKKNTYSYLRCVDAADGKTVFEVPVPALTYLWISPDSKYIVGLSKVKLWNPYNLVVFDLSGQLIYKDYISPQSPYSNNFDESVTNWVYWYKEDDPKIVCKEKNGALASLFLLDPKGEGLLIPIVTKAEENKHKLSKEKAVEIAKVYALKKGMDLKQYAAPNARFVENRRVWHVYFEKVPHRIGGMFCVEVDDISGKAVNLLYGE